jgi:CDP-alcohol phosphatidyltransferase
MIRKRITNLFEEYKRSLKMAEVEEALDLFFYRPVAFLLVKSIYRTNITPDHLTLGAIILGLTGGFFYALGLQQTSVIGAIFYILFVIFDCSDGQLARLKKNGTKIGRLLDGIADYIVVTAIYVGLAIGYTQKAGHPSVLLLILALSGASITIQSLLVDYYRTRFLDIVLNRTNTFKDGIHGYRTEYIKIKNQKGKWLEKNIILIYLFYSKVQRRIIGKTKRESPIIASPRDYYDKNRAMIRLWLIMGPSAIRTWLIVCSFIGRFDIYFWVTIAGFNILAIILAIVQHRIDKSYSALPIKSIKEQTETFV